MGFRKLLETAAAERRWSCVFDDIHWAEQTFLDLIEHVADLSRGAPILLLCMARPELLDRAGLGRRQGERDQRLLEPLDADEAALLASLERSSTDGLRERIAARPGATRCSSRRWWRWPRDRATARSTVPPTIQALLAARLDQLDGGRARRARARRVEGAASTAARSRRSRPEEPQVTPSSRRSSARSSSGRTAAASPARTPSASGTS